MITDSFGDFRLYSLGLGERMTDQGNLRHVFSRNLDSTRFAIAILHSLRATDLTEFCPAWRDLPYLRQEFVEIAQASRLVVSQNDER